jgi:hypothetical protein
MSVLLYLKFENTFFLEILKSQKDLIFLKMLKKMNSSTLFKRDFQLGKFLISILNYDFPRFTFVKLPKRIVIDFFYWQIWVSKV